MHMRLSVVPGASCLPGPGAGRRLARRTSSSYNLSGSSRVYPAPGWRLAGQRATHYESVPVRCSRGSKPALASCSQVAAGGDRWLLMAIRGHAPVMRVQVLGGAAPTNDRPFFRPDIPPVSAYCASVMRCRRSLPLAGVRCCCCHCCCQPRSGERAARRDQAVRVV